MSKISDLLLELCPNGVQFLRVDQVCVRKSGLPLTAGEMKVLNTKGGDVRIFAGGQTFADVTCKSIDGKYIEGPGLIVKSRGIIDFEFWLGRYSHKNELWSYQPKNEDVNLKFLYYFLKTKVFEVQLIAKANSVKMPQIKVGDIDGMFIPVPPIEIQHEIVRILDSFRELEAGLEAELEARKTQFDHLRTELIRRYSENCSPLPLGSLITYLRTGLNPRQNFVLNPPGATCAYITVRELDGFKIRPSEKTDRVDERGFDAIQSRSRLQAGDVLFSATGTIGRTALVEETPTNWGIKEGVYAITTDPTQLDPRFLIYLIGHSAIYDEIIARSEGSTVRSISMASLKSLQLQLPPLTVQKRITDILDVAHELAFESLPSEINARRKQYDYYRSRLLTFKKLEVE